MAGRFIKLYDKILDWEWFRFPNTLSLFVYLLLKANYKDMRFEGRVIKRGQLVTSLSSLAKATGQTERQIRVSLDRLKMSGEVSSLTCPRYRIITITKYDEYQSDGKRNVTLMTGSVSPSGQAECHPDDKQNGRLVTTSIEDIEYRTGRKIDTSPSVSGRAPRFTPPTRDEVDRFCLENGLVTDVDRFMDHYQGNGWMVGSVPMQDWKPIVRKWAREDAEKAQKSAVSGYQQRPAKEVIAQQYQQRDYSDRNDRALNDFLKLVGTDDMYGG